MTFGLSSYFLPPPLLAQETAPKRSMEDFPFIGSFLHWSSLTLVVINDDAIAAGQQTLRIKEVTLSSTGKYVVKGTFTTVEGERYSFTNRMLQPPQNGEEVCLSKEGGQQRCYCARRGKSVLSSKLYGERGEEHGCVFTFNIRMLEVIYG